MFCLKYLNLNSPLTPQTNGAHRFVQMLELRHLTSMNLLSILVLAFLFFLLLRNILRRS